MAYACATILGKRLEARLEPWLTEDLARLADSIGQMFQPVLELAEEEGEDGTAGYRPAWGRLLEVQLVPAKDLAYLGQFVGVEIPKVDSESEAREIVKAEAGLERGTRKSIESAIKRIIGAASFNIQERTNKAGGAAAYAFNVIVGSGKKTTALVEAIEAVKPGGIIMSVIEATGLWLNGAKKWSGIAAGKKWSEMTEGNY